MNLNTRIFAAAAGLALAAFLLGAGQDAHQPKPEVLELPEANPEDVKSINAIVDAMYAIETGKPGEPRDWDRLLGLYHPLARLVAARPAGPSGNEIMILSVDEYIKAEKKYLEAAGFHAKDIMREVQQFGNIAHVLSTFEYRRNAEDPEPYSRGMNSIQLLRNLDRWWIVTVYWDYERADNPLPDSLLPDHMKHGG